MKKYAQIINAETKECSVGLGTDATFYKSIGMTEQSVEEAWNGRWYIEGFAPVKPDSAKAEEVRCLRNQFLEKTDKYMIADYPIESADRERYQAYRQYLRDISAERAFPNVSVKTFEEWKEEQVCANNA